VLCVFSQYPFLVLSKHQTDQIQPKLLSKHVFRLMEKFCIDPGVCVDTLIIFINACVFDVYAFVSTGLCSNSVYKRKLDSLRFLMYKTFVEVRESFSLHHISQKHIRASSVKVLELYFLYLCWIHMVLKNRFQGKFLFSDSIYVRWCNHQVRKYFFDPFDK